ncbi:MAG: hypothetical protein N3F09_03030 [Bacteroidia bacterium]|nr:hypothetical protein [Bacteroidia bacterium]
MNPDRLAELVKHPWVMEPSDLPGLEKIIHEYPFFTTARLLYLYSAWRFDRIRYDKCIADLPALSVGASEVYYWLNHQPTDEKSKEKETRTDSKTDNTSINQSNLPNVTLQFQTKENNENQNKTSEDEPLDDKSFLEKNIKSGAALASLHLQLTGHSTPPKNLSDQSPEPQPEIGKKSQTAETQKTGEFSSDNHDNRKNFLEWLKSFEIVGSNTHFTSEEEIEEINLKRSEPNEDKAKSDLRKKKWEILDDIIKKNPGPIKPRLGEVQNFYQAEKAARESLLESEEFVTETLANIYLMQGHYAKAIRVFEILSLKIPQKSSYFAEKIREIKDKQKNKNL